VFFEDCLPIIVYVSPFEGMDEAGIAEMEAGFEKLWARGDRYAVVSHRPVHYPTLNAKSRKLIGEWANRPRTKEQARRHCVGAATVVQNALARGAMTAILWIFEPTAPHQLVPTPTAAVDYCIEKCLGDGLTLPRGEAETRRRLYEFFASVDERTRR